MTSSSSFLRFVVDGFDVANTLFLLSCLEPLLCAMWGISTRSPEICWRKRRCPVHMKHTRAEQRELGTTIHASFQELEPVYMPFERPLAPRQCQPCQHRSLVLLDAFGKRLELGQTAR